LPEGDRIRLDKWLWQARFFRTRAQSAGVAASGRLRLNGQPCRKPGHAVGPGDVLSFPAGDRLCEVRVLACGTRRGPAPEAALLYADLTQPDPLARRGASD
jgi:ribosome-associated heat shock protein Hsp15